MPCGLRGQPGFSCQEVPDDSWDAGWIELGDNTPSSLIPEPLDVTCCVLVGSWSSFWKFPEMFLGMGLLSPSLRHLASFGPGEFPCSSQCHRLFAWISPPRTFTVWKLIVSQSFRFLFVPCCFRYILSFCSFCKISTTSSSKSSKTNKKCSLAIPFCNILFLFHEYNLFFLRTFWTVRFVSFLLPGESISPVCYFCSLSL